MASYDLLIPEPHPAIFTAEGLSFVMLVFPPAGDGIPPIMDQFDPPAGATLAKSASLRFRLRENEAYALRDLWIGYGQSPTGFELVHDGVDFLGAYTNSTLETLENGDLIFTLRRTSGWPYGSQVRLRCNVVDSGGNVVVIGA